MNYGNKKTEKYISIRIKQVSNLSISADHKIEKLDHINKYVSAFRKELPSWTRVLLMLRLTQA